MNKLEEIILEKSGNEKELSDAKNYKKIKYSIAIITSTLIIAVITLLIGHFKFEMMEQGTKPVVRNLGFNISASKTYNLGSFNVTGQIISIKYVVIITDTQCQNKIVITSGSGSFEFGNTGISSPGNGTKSYMTPIFKIRVPEIPIDFIKGYAKGSLSCDVQMRFPNQYYIRLKGTLELYTDIKYSTGSIVKATCEGKGILADIKGQLLALNKRIERYVDFSLGMGNLKIIYNIKSSDIDKQSTITLFEGWRKFD